MPEMNTTQKVQFLQHVHHCIFGVIRFPFDEPPGQPRFVTYAAAFQERVKQVLTGAEWAPWVIGGRVCAITFKCAERGAKILMGYDINLDLGRPQPYPIRVLEQNPFKLDHNGNLKHTAIMAQRGHQIAWVILNNRSNTFLGKVQDGVFEASKPRAYTNKTMTPLPGMGAGIVSTDTRPDQYGVDHFNMDGDWIDDLDVIGGEDDVVGCV